MGRRLRRARRFLGSGGPGRKALFSLIVLIFVFGSAELLLRAILGSPPPYDALARIDKCRVRADGPDHARLDCQPGEDADLRVRARAPEGRRRVVFLGESSVRQTGIHPIPYAFADAVAEASPDLDVLNFGVTGLSAAGIGRLAADLEAVHPDLVVIYSGHNEYNNDVFRGAISGTRLWMTPIYRLLGASWIHGLLARAPRGASFADRPRAAVNAIEDDLAFRVRDAVEARFRQDLAQAVRASPAPVLLCTMLRNPGFPPTGTLVTDHPDCARALKIISGPGALERRLATAEQLCGDGAITAWLRFQQAQASGDREGALAHWRRSLDLDALPLRAPSTADPVIRAVAAETGAGVVDLEARYGPWAQPAWFSDNLHFSREGARVVGAELSEPIRRALAP